MKLERKRSKTLQSGVRKYILNFGNFTVAKYVLHNKIINKTRTKKDQENSS